MNNLWRLKERGDSQHWNRKISQLISSLEMTGCEFNFPSQAEDESLAVFFPGLDSFILDILNSSPSPVAEQCLRSARAYLWDRVELKLNRESQSIECRWIYWSPFQIFLHTSVSALFLLKIWSLQGASLGELTLLLVSCAMTNYLAVFMSEREESRLNELFLASGFIR